MRMFLVVLGLVGCASPATPVKSSPAAAQPRAPRGLEQPTPTLRLPRNFLPTGYQATLAIDPSRAGFDGTIAITGNLAESSSVIWLHGHNLTIKRAMAAHGPGHTELIATPRGDDLLELRADAPLAAGGWTVTIEYAGLYDEVGTSGVYKQTVGGIPYIFTQLEAVYARRAFPCFDEPDNKVPWTLTLDVPDGLVAVGNTPIAHDRAVGPHTKRIEFATTRPLPSYLVAFGVGAFDIVDAGKTQRGTPVRVVTMKDRAPDAAWAVQTGPRLVDLLEDFFGSPYPYEKLDFLAVPVTVGFGAMENAGLITFTETLILLDPKLASENRRYRWVVTAAHELAHQWFGDLVTTAWWDDIWLNEGFATWVERKISARFEPAWQEEVAVVEARNAALGADALVSARQIRQPIVTAGDIINAFDVITYRKGASVLTMVEGDVGPEVFMRGVRAYLQDHAFGNATSSDFAAAISRAADHDVRTALATFLEQPGAPEITATLACDPGAPPRLELRQARYVPPGSTAPAAGKPWSVPVCVAFERDGKRAEACARLDAATSAITLEAPRCPRWVMPNADGRGYYRDSYTPAEVEALRDQAWSALRATERQALVFDVGEAAMVGKLPLALAMSFVPKLIAAGDRASIRSAYRISRAVSTVVPDELYPRYEDWMRRAFAPAARRAGVSPRSGEGLDVETARSFLIAAAGTIGRDPALAGQALALFEHWRDLPQAIRGDVLDVAVRASPRVFERALAQVVGEPDRARRDEVLGALSGAPDAAQQRATLALVLDPRLDIRDTQYLLVSGEREVAHVVAQQFFRDHKDEILRRLPTGSATGSVAWLASVFTASCKADRRAEIATYVTETFAALEGGDRVIKQAIERMDQCIARRQLLEPAVRAWLLGAARVNAR